MHGPSQEFSAEASTMLGSAGTLQMIQKWVGSSCIDSPAARFQDDRQLKAHMAHMAHSPARLSQSTSENLPSHTTATSSSKHLKSPDIDWQRPWIDALSHDTQDAKQECTDLFLGQESADGAWCRSRNGTITPESKPWLETPVTPVKVSVNPRRTLKVEGPIQKSKSGKSGKTQVQGPRGSRPRKLTRVSARHVPQNLQGLFDAKDGLQEAFDSQDLHKAVSWLKGLGRRKVAAHELEKTRIGLTVNACRKTAEPFVTKLAEILLQRRGAGSRLFFDVFCKIGALVVKSRSQVEA